MGTGPPRTRPTRPPTSNPPLGVILAAAVVVLAYLGGSIPSGVLLARTVGIDVRRAGSGNIGATNVARTAGARLGLFTLVADVAKGYVPVMLVRSVVAGDVVPACVGFAAFLGHLFPPMLGFIGGKGVATALGVSLALYPLACLPAVAAFGLCLAAFRWVSVGSIAGAVVMPVAVWWLGYPRSHLGVAIVMAILIAIRHRGNVARLVAGTEPKALLKRQAEPTK